MAHYRKNALRTQRIDRPHGCVHISEQMDPISKHLKFFYSWNSSDLKVAAQAVKTTCKTEMRKILLQEFDR